MSQFIINGRRKLSGTIPVYGSKNAALPLITASLLSKETITLSNIPAITDVDNLLDILSSLGVTVARQDDQISLTAAELTPEKLPHDKVGQLRGSILLMGALLGRTRQVTLPKPGGDMIGARPIDVHLDAFRQLGATITEADGLVTIDGSNLKPGTVILKELSVTATENVLLAASLLPGKTTIHISATEPHVTALAHFLTKAGAPVSGIGTHSLTIQGAESLTGTTFTNIYDMIEAGSFILLAASSNSDINIEHVPVDDLRSFFKKIDDIGISYEINDTSVHLKPSASLKSFKIQTMPFPGIPTDLQAPFSVIATQAHGSSLIHDPMYEGRFRHINEMQKMGAKVTVCDPHRAIIEGPTELKGKHIKSLDLRAGATLLMAGLIAEGTTTIDDAEIIDRGYANLTQRLTDIGVDIKRVD